MIPVLRGPQLTWKFSIPSSNSKPFWRNTHWSYIAGQRVVTDDFADHIYHVGNSHDLHSIIQSGLIPGGKSIKKERHAVFFTAVNPTFVDQDKEVGYDLTNSRVAVYRNHLKNHQITVYWCNLKVAQKKGLQFYRTRSKAIILYNTLPAVCIEKVVYMKSGEELYNKVYQSPKLPQKAVLKPNLCHGRQDSSNFVWSENIRRPSKQRKRRVRGNPWRYPKLQRNWRVRTNPQR